MKEIALKVNGQERLFSEEELTAIVGKPFSNAPDERVSTGKTVQVATEVAQVPTEGKWFYVDPQSIDQALFAFYRKNLQQEETRRRILEAFEALKKAPEKYGRKFKTMMPKKDWDSKTVEELKELACKLGDHNAYWVEQALEWAQRICNGESWKTICNNPDTANWYRLVVWKNDYVRLVGGSRNGNSLYPASSVSNYDYLLYGRIISTVPLVVRYEQDHQHCAIGCALRAGSSALSTV